jgi:hypothetical protein
MLVNSAITFTQDPRLRSLSGSMVAHLDSYSMIKRTGATDSNKRSAKLEYFDQVKRNVDWKMDENTLRLKLNDSVSLIL